MRRVRRQNSVPTARFLAAVAKTVRSFAAESPRRLSFKKGESAIAVPLCLADQHAIAVAEKTVAFRDGLAVRLENKFAASERRD